MSSAGHVGGAVSPASLLSLKRVGLIGIKSPTFPIYSLQSGRKQWHQPVGLRTTVRPYFIHTTASNKPGCSLKRDVSATTNRTMMQTALKHWAAISLSNHHYMSLQAFGPIPQVIQGENTPLLHKCLKQMPPSYTPEMRSEFFSSLRDRMFSLSSRSEAVLSKTVSLRKCRGGRVPMVSPHHKCRMRCSPGSMLNLLRSGRIRFCSRRGKSRLPPWLRKIWAYMRLLVQSLCFNTLTDSDVMFDSIFEPVFWTVDYVTRWFGLVFVCLVVILTSSILVIAYIVLLPLILNTYSPAWIAWHICYGHWNLIMIAFHYYKAAKTSPGYPPTVSSQNLLLCRTTSLTVLPFFCSLKMHNTFSFS
ncbi:hypothetical protein CCH79_00001620 [Gambusia affinis]|uniref:Uncharacterized protein n=1 Tax=Gambusia affinis TaxID=33528 RepID=A0A315VRA2_GAMAF|nr:hypothetical protein CCH79_00001620 [Gambusia affinis]